MNYEKRNRNNYSLSKIANIVESSKEIHLKYEFNKGKILLRKIKADISIYQNGCIFYFILVSH